jgi:hypothetical protein
MAASSDDELAAMLMGTFADDGISDDEAQELEQVRDWTRSAVCFPTGSSQTLAELANEPDGLSEEELFAFGSARVEEAAMVGEAIAESARVEAATAVATAEMTEEDVFAARLAALDAFAKRAAAANADMAADFHDSRVVELEEQGRKLLEEALEASGALARAFASAAGDTHVALLRRMQALQELSLQAERTLAALRKREGELAERLGDAEAARAEAQHALEMAEAALAESALEESARLATEAECERARLALGEAEQIAEAERQVLQANMAARADAREKELAAGEARRARIERLRALKRERHAREEAAAQRRIAQMAEELARMQEAAGEAHEMAKKALEDRKRAEEAAARKRAEAEREAEARRLARAEAELARRRRKMAKNIFLDLAVPAKHVAFVVDRSGSMTWRGVWVYVARQLEQALSTLDPSGKFRLVAFNEGVKWHTKEAVQSTSANAARAMAWLERLDVIGGCSPKENFGKPLLEVLNGGGEIAQIFLVSDTDGKEYEAARDAARARGVQINCLYMCPDGRPIPPSMTDLARSTGGHTKVIVATSSSS